MKRNKKKEQIVPGTKSGKCPYCGGSIVLRSADGIYRENSGGTMLYVCSGYPECDAYVRVIPGSKTPIGSMANGTLRTLRSEAHLYFDRLYLTGIMTRSEAYEWLAGMLQAPLSQAHIGHLGEYYCRKVIEESKRILDNWHRVHGGQPCHEVKRAAGGEIYAVK